MNGLRIGAVGTAMIIVLLTPAVAPAQNGGMVASLVDQLGVTETQAQGGVQALLATAKGRLSGEDFTSLLDAAPDLGSLAAMGEGMPAAGEVMEMAEGASEMAEGASEMAATATETAEGAGDEASAAMSGAMDSASAAMGAAGGAMGGLDLSSLAQLTDLTKSFEGLGLDAGMVQKFVPIVLEQLGSGSNAAGLLKKGLGLVSG